MLWSKSFWAGAGERAIKTFVQAFAGVTLVALTAGIVTPEALLAAPWLTGLCSAGLAAVMSLATSVMNADFTSGAKTPMQNPQEAPSVPVAHY